MSERTLIGISLVEPPKRSKDKAEIHRLWCSLDDPFERCPVLALGQCITRQFLAFPCVYGRRTCQEGWTRRAKKYNSWVAAARKEQGPRMPAYPDKRLAVVGQYVWLPYAQMSMCEAVPFLAHSHFLISGRPFVKVKDFTPEVVVTLVKFRPYALMGGEIRSYQNDSVPRFLYDLKHLQPALYQSAADLDPVIVERTPSPKRFKDTKVPIGMVKVGTACSLVGFRFVWNGPRIELKIEASDISWGWKCGREKMKDVVLSFTPDPELPVTVEDETELARLFQAGVFALGLASQ